MLEPNFRHLIFVFMNLIKSRLQLLILPALLLSVFAGCAHLGLSAKSSEIALFNGKNLDGWTIQSNGKFSVEDGVIKINRGNGWLRSVDTYADYTLVMEFRFLEKEANSGIFVRTGPTSKRISKKDKRGYPDNGYQVQCKDTFKEKALGEMIPYGAPPFDTEFSLDALKKAYKPMGEWHTYEITAKGETLEVKLNGIVVSTATNIKNLDGHIGIQGEEGLLEFRKIALIKL